MYSNNFNEDTIENIGKLNEEYQKDKMNSEIDSKKKEKYNIRILSEGMKLNVINRNYNYRPY